MTTLKKPSPMPRNTAAPIALEASVVSAGKMSTSNRLTTDMNSASTITAFERFKDATAKNEMERLDEGNIQ